MTRLFVALDLPDPVRDALGRVRWGLEGARWTEPESLHLTLAFIGEVDGPTAHRAREGLAAVSAEPFFLRLGGFGCFPPRGEPRVLWAGFEQSEPLERLARAVRDRLRRLSVPVDRRQFAPHVTLARLRHTPARQVIEGLGCVPELPRLTFEVRHFSLFSSRLGRGGALHRPEAAYPLRSP